MESQKHVELVEALVYWCLVDELMWFEGINEGQFFMDYDVMFKPTVKLMQWIAHLKDWPSVLLGALQSQESSCSHVSLPCLPKGTTLLAEQKELWQDLLAACSWTCCGHLSYWQKVLHLIEGVAWQLRWMHHTWGNPEAYGNKLQMFAIEMGMSELWQQVQGSMSTVTAQNKDAIATLIQCVTVSPLILFKWNKDATPIPVQSLLYACSFDDWEKPVVLKNVEKGLWSLLLGVVGGTFEPKEGLVCFLQTFRPEFKEAAHTIQISPWFDIAAWLKPLRGSKTASIQVALDAIAHVESMVSLPSTSNNNEDASAVEDKHAVAGGLEKAEDIQITVADNGMPVKTKAGADADKSPSEEERVPKKCKKKTKKKSQDLASEDNDVEESRAVSSAHAFKHHKPLPFRLSKSELKVYTDNGADDEDYVWHQGFLQASHTKGPVMDAVQRPLCIKRSVAPVSPDLPPKSLPQLPINNWGWNSWMARELGDLDMPIQVHELVQHVTDSSNWSTKPTMEITSSLRTVLEESLKENKGRILNALTLPMPDTMLQSSLFLQAASHLDACKGTWGLASNAGAMTPPHMDFGGSAIKIDCPHRVQALSKCQDEYWDDLHFAFMQYWELVSWGNERLALTGMDGSDDVYELYMAVKLSVLQFGLALLDYHTSVADSPLYEALDSGDQFNCIWFQSDVLGAFDQTFGKELQQEQRKKRHQPEDNLFWDILFSISTVEDQICPLAEGDYDELPPIEEETDSSASSSLTDLLESEPLQSPPPAPAMMLVSMRTWQARNLRTPHQQWKKTSGILQLNDLTQ
ncbi:hypothetical protein F5146DRAFT_1228388 [Armillaria mellea]|nr:hypothetical protein F5146DRAFT_1228388 [Armillaria mellea]